MKYNEITIQKKNINKRKKNLIDLDKDNELNYFFFIGNFILLFTFYFQ